MSDFKFSVTLIVIKVINNECSLYPYIRRNLNPSELRNQLITFVCNQLAKEYVDKALDYMIEFNNSSLEIKNYYQSSQEAFRQINDNVNGLFINISLFVN